MQCHSATLFIFVTQLILISVRSQFRFTLPPIDSEESPTLSVQDAQGNPVEAPRGIFHYSDTEQNLESRFKVPDFEELDPLKIAQDLMSTAAKAQTRRKSLGGFNVPLPIGGSPVNLQVSSDTRSGVSMAADEKENSTKSKITATGPAREAFEKAKSVCLHSNSNSCDEALDTYYRVKYGTSLMPSTSSTESVSSDPATDFATIMVPGLDKKLEELVTEVPHTTSREIRRMEIRSRNLSSPRLPPRSPTQSREQKIRVISVRSQFRFTLPPIDSEESPTLSVQDAQGNPVEAPRGIFHYSDTEQNLESRFKVPDFEELDPLKIAQDLMSTAAKAQTRRKSLGGFNVPLPIGGSPVNLQVSSDTRSGVSMAADEKENSTKSKITATGPAREAFEKAKSVCLHSNSNSCDEALDTYYRVKYGTSLMPSTSSTESVSSDPATDFATIMVPGLDKKLEELVTEVPHTTSREIRRMEIRSRNLSSPRLPPRSPTQSREQKIRGFLHRLESR